MFSVETQHNSIAEARLRRKNSNVSVASKPIFQVSVRELVEFALRSGDLGGGREFVGSERALAGTRGHQRIQKSRPTGYKKEVPLVFDVETPEFILRVQGRIDGLLVTPEEVLLEEIKTVQGRWDVKPDSLHWAQAKIYGFIYAHQHALKTLTLQLTYLHLETNEQTEFREQCELTRLSALFDQAIGVYLTWVRYRHSWCRRRDDSIAALKFPFSHYRSGQRKLAVAAYRALVSGHNLFAEAPTGIGKTISVLFPAIKALGEGRLERIYYLTAKTVVRTVAENTLAEMRQAGLKLRTLTLSAREKICFQNAPCDPANCPFAAGYYDRFKEAMRAALDTEAITQTALQEVARKHQVCPHELSLDLSLWVDGVICDYNYLFDPRVYLRRHFQETSGDYGFLIDEAHNLVERAREMFSAELCTREIHKTRRALGKALPGCARALARLGTAMRKLCAPSSRTRADSDDAEPNGELQLFPLKQNGSEPDTTKTPSKSSTRQDSCSTSREFPASLPPLLEKALKEAEQWLAQNQPAEFRESLLELYFKLHSFLRTAQLYDERYVTIVESGRSTRVKLFCLDPSHLLKQALKRGKAALFFSATLSPGDYYGDLLGGEPKDPQLQLPSPFPPENLLVLVQARIRTDYKARRHSLEEVVQVIGSFVRGRAGNYMIYLPSYEYLKLVLEQFRLRFPELRVLEQVPGMSEAERASFLNTFTTAHQEHLVGFAVLGGVFGEGIDLVGERLIGAVIVGVGLPQLCVERDLIRDYFSQEHEPERGFDYAYTFPGMNRVLQAIGRVIRSETDRGAVLLIDTRYNQERYRQLFPRWWNPVPLRHASEIQRVLSSFWRSS